MNIFIILLAVPKKKTGKSKTATHKAQWHKLAKKACQKSYSLSKSIINKARISEKINQN